jgi:hypothetical protein
MNAGVRAVLGEEEVKHTTDQADGRQPVGRNVFYYTIIIFRQPIAWRIEKFERGVSATILTLAVIAAIGRCAQ